MSGTTHSAAGRRAAIGLAAAGLAALLLVLGPSALAGSASAKPRQPGQTAAASEQQARAAYARLPLGFVPNAGQLDRRVRYSAQTGGASFYFTQKEAVFAFTKGKKGSVLRLAFLGANPQPRIEGQLLQAGRVNYLLGSDPAKWHTNLPTYGQLVYRELWPGVDMVFRGAAGRLKYEFHVAPGAKVGDIRLAYGGADRLSLSRAGDLLIGTSLGTLRDSQPASYQQVGGRRVPVASGYALEGSKYGFALGAYDRSRTLVIDPGLVYSTYLGGSDNDGGFDIAVDSVGNAYVTGRTFSTNFPTTTGAFDIGLSGLSDAFVTKLNPAGTSLVYSTFLGGTTFDEGTSIAVDALGNAHVSGTTSSADFPTTVSGFDTVLGGGNDAFVTKLNAAGSALLYSTYLGGSVDDFGQSGIALDSVGNIHVSGITASTDFPTTVAAFQTAYGGGTYDAFVAKLNPNAAGAASLVYSTYLGGSDQDQGSAIALDAAGNAHVTGLTFSADFPSTVGAFDTTYDASFDAYVTKVNATGTGLVYSTFLGTSGADIGNGIAVDAAANAYVTGQTDSAGFPTTLLAYDNTHNGGFDAFVTKFNPAGTSLVYSTYLGGTDFDGGDGIALDAQGNAHVSGTTGSPDFPTTGAFDTALGGILDAFATKLNATGSALDYSTYLGGSGQEFRIGIALDVAGNAYLTGTTQSADFPTAPGAFQTTYGGGTGDGFVTKLGTAAVPATLLLTPPADTNDVGTSHTVTATVTDAGGNPVEGVVVRFTVTGSVNTTGQCTTDVNGQCDFTYDGPDFPGTDAITAYADTDGDNIQDVGEPTGAATKAWVLPVSTPLCEVTISDGGRITAANGDRATFGGNAKVPEAGDPSGNQTYRDHGPAQPLTVKSINVLAVVCSADRTEATLFGQATIDGAGSFFYRIRLRDGGDPGQGIDVYGILLETGYFSGDKTLEAGNVQITVHE